LEKERVRRGGGKKDSLRSGEKVRPQTMNGNRADVKQKNIERETKGEEAIKGKQGEGLRTHGLQRKKGTDGETEEHIR